MAPTSTAFLPERQWDVLAGLLAGMSVDEVWADLGAHLTDAETVDPDDVTRAIERSTDRVVLVDGPTELLAVLSRPFELWRVYLHPTQQKVVDAAYSGPARVTGGPGTGKTVVALHRTRRLAQRLTADRPHTRTNGANAHVNTNAGTNAPSNGADDLDDGLDRIASYRSPLHGRHPTPTGYRNRAAELTGLTEAVHAWLDHGIRPEEIGVAVRSNTLAGRALTDADIPVRLLAQRNQPETAVAVGTMHRTKGLEFRCMAVAALNDHTMPVAVTPEADDPLTHDLQRDSSAVHVWTWATTSSMLTRRRTPPGHRKVLDPQL